MRAAWRGAGNDRERGAGGETAAAGRQRLDAIVSGGRYPNAHTLLYWQGAAAVIDFIQEVDPLVLRSPDSPDYRFAGQLAATLDAVEADIREAVDRARSAGLTVYLTTYYTGRESVQPCRPLLLDVILPVQVRNANAYIVLLNERIRRAAADTGATLVDLAAADAELKADPANYFDCNHLSARGNAIVAQRFFVLLSESE